MDPGHAAVLVVAGIAAGWMNTVAGAGGIIAIPALLLSGLSAPVANGTNRVAIVAQSVVGLAGYRRAQVLPAQGRGAIIPAVVGAGGGAYLATVLEPRVIEILLVAAFGVVVVAALYMPRAPAPDRPLHTGATAMLGMLIAGFYGGLVQTGVGLILLTVLATIVGHDLVAANALKVLATLAFSVIALVVFIAAGDVEWVPGLWMAAGSMVGAWLGVRFAVKAGHAAIRAAVIVISLAAAIVVLVR